MFCGNCGKELNDNVKFCGNCGAKMESHNQIINDVVSEPVSKKEGKDWKKMSIIIAVVVVIAVVGVIGLGLFGEKKSNKFLALLESGKTEEAMEYYEEILYEDEEELQIATEKVAEKIESLINDFNEGKIAYLDAVEKIGLYEEFYPSEIATATNVIQDLYHSKGFFSQAEENYANGDYKAAYAIYTRVDENDKNYSEAIEKMEECYTYILEEAWNQSAELAADKNYIEAIAKIQSYRNYFKAEDWVLAEKKIEEYANAYLSDIESQINTYLEKGLYEDSFSLIQYAEDAIGENSKTTLLKRTVTEKFEEYVKNCVEEYKVQKAYTDGIIFLNNAELILPNSEVISALHTELQKYLPVKLSDVHVFDEDMDSYYESMGQMDSYQNEYEYAMNCSIYTGGKEQTYVEYLLKDMYQHFSCVLAPIEKWKNENAIKVTIWGDGVKLYETTLTYDSHPINVELDVTGIEKLKISFQKDNYYRKYYMLLGNPYLYEKY